MNLKYTLAFIRHRIWGDDQILMLRREADPYRGMYNGVGGKLKPGETPIDCVRREICEETGLQVCNLRFGGIATWARGESIEGMYLYTADWTEKVTPDNVHLMGARKVKEGVLQWMPTYWCCSPHHVLIDNIPHFLPRMLKGVDPVRYHCVYGEDGAIVRVDQLPLPDGLEGVE